MQCSLAAFNLHTRIYLHKLNKNFACTLLRILSFPYLHVSYTSRNKPYLNLYLSVCLSGNVFCPQFTGKRGNVGFWWNTPPPPPPWFNACMRQCYKLLKSVIRMAATKNLYCFMCFCPRFTGKRRGPFLKTLFPHVICIHYMVKVYQYLKLIYIF